MVVILLGATDCTEDADQVLSRLHAQDMDAVMKGRDDAADKKSIIVKDGGWTWTCTLMV